MSVKTNLDSILKSRHITQPIKIRLVKAMVFPIVMYGCESWTIKKAESWRTDAFELWCWRRLLSPLDCKEIQPVHSEDQPWDFFGRKAMTKLDSILKSRDITLPTKIRIVKAMVYPVVTYGCESCAIKKAECQRIGAFELWCWRRLLSPLDCKEIKSVSLKGNQSWIFIGKTDAKAEAPILWPPDVNSWLTGKDPDCGKHWWQEEKGATEKEMVG